jgi:DNA-binding protein HU-beta
MNKGELVDRVAETASVTKKQADTVLSAALEPRNRQKREGRNPRTGEKMEIPATKVPAFSAGKLFKDKVSESKDD